MEHTFRFARDQQNKDDRILQETVMRIVNANLLYVSPRLRWDTQKAHWGLTWTSNSLFGILWLMAFLDLLRPGEFHSCPRCNHIFLATSPRVRFCSVQCGNVYKVQKFQREKKKGTSRTKRQEG